MTTSHYFRDRDGALVGPGDYEIVGTIARVHSVSKSNGLTIDKQVTVVVHTVEPVEEESPAPCIHCGEARSKHSEDREACVRAGFWGNRYTPADTPADNQANNPDDDEPETDRTETLERALAEIRAAFYACFTPDFAGVDWRDDVAIQTLARTCWPVLARTAPKEIL